MNTLEKPKRLCGGTPEQWIDQILAEYNCATQKFGKFNSAHEGYAVLLEEVDELWDEIKKKDADYRSMQDEARQVAAMALRFLVDIC